MKTDKLLSICVPTYNRPDFLKRNLLSIISQTINSNEIEVIVSDDSDNGSCLKVIDDMNRCSPLRIVYYKNLQPDNVLPASKQAHNVNNLIQHARGRFIYIIHDDDFLVDGGLKEIINEIKMNGSRYKVFLFGVRLIDANGKLKRVQRRRKSRIYSNTEAVRKLTKDSSFVRTPAIIIGNDVYNKVGLYNADIQIPLDFDMWTRVFPYYDLYYSKSVVANYTDHTNNQTTQMFNEKYLKIILSIFNKLKRKKIIDDFELSKNQSYFFHQWILAGVYRNLKLGKFKKAKKVFDLFYIDEIKTMPPAYKWLPVRFVFQAILALRYRSLPQ